MKGVAVMPVARSEETIVVWKDGSHRFFDGPTWEAENDPDWLVTIPLSVGSAVETPEYRKWPGEPPHCMSCDCGMTDTQKRMVPEADYLRIHRELMDLKYPGGRPSEKATARYPGMQICHKKTQNGPCLNEIDHQGECDGLPHL